MNKIRWVIVGSLVSALGYSLYLWNDKNARRSEIDSQVAAAQIKVLRDIASESKKAAEASDLKAVALAKTAEEAKQAALAEHLKTEALKKKLALSGLQPLPPIVGGGGLGIGEDNSALMSQVISQQENEIQSLNTVIINQDEQIKTLTISRDGWKESALKFESSLVMSDKQIRALEIQRDAFKRSGVFREAKGMLEGGAVVFVLTLLKVL